MAKKKINSELRSYLMGLKPDNSIGNDANTGGNIMPSDLSFYKTGKEEWSDYDKGTFLDENVEERRSRNQGTLDKLGIGLTRLAGKTLTTTAESAGFVGGLLGIDNHSDEHGGGFSGWIAGAADNGLAVVAKDLEQNLKDATPLYNSIADKAANQANLFSNLADADFWAGDAVDAGAFLASAWLTGGATAELQLGERAALGLAKNAVTKGLVAGKLAKVANATNLVTATALNTASEAMFEAKDVRDKLREQKAKELYGMSYDMLREDTKQEINTQVAPAAAKTFALNSLLLAGPNLLEMKSLMKTAGRASSEVTGLGSKGFNTTLAEAEGKIGLPFGQSLDVSKVPYLGAGVKKFNKFAASKTGSNLIAATQGIVREGGEENLQLAISNMLENDPDADLTDLSTYSNLTRNVADNFSTEEGKKSMLLGSLIGGISNTISNNIDYNRNKKRQNAAILETNLAGANLFAANDIYQTETYTETVDGKEVTKSRYKLDDQGNPIEDKAKIKALSDQKAKFEYLDDIATLAEEKGDDVLANLAKANKMAQWVKVHYDTGTEDLLNAKIAHLEQLSDKEYLEQGLDPSQKTQFIAELKNKVQSYKKLARTIDSSLLTRDKSKEGGRNFLNRKSELYNLGTTLEDIASERNRLTVEKAELEASPEMSTLNQKRRAYIDLKVNELNEAETKFREEFNKIADANKGEKYFNNDYKKSALQKVDSFNPETVTLDEFNNYENSKMFSKKLQLKGQNIENEFFEKGVEDRLSTDGESAVDVINDLTENKIPVTEKTKETLQSQLEEDKNAIERLFELANLLTTGYDVDTEGYSDSEIAQVQALLQDEPAQEELGNKLAQIDDALEKLKNLQTSSNSEVNNKTIKSKLVEGFTKLTNSILFNVKSNENYDNLSELEKQQKGLFNMIKVLKEKGDEDYNDVIKEYEDSLKQIEEAITVVKERLNNRALQQEKIVNNAVNLNINKLGLTTDGKISNQRVYDIFKIFLGDKIDNVINQIKDLTAWGKIGYLTNILNEIRPQITKEQIGLLTNIKNELANQLTTILKSEAVEKFTIDLYKDNPKFVFTDLVSLLLKYDDAIYRNFRNDFDFFKLKEALKNPEVKTRIDYVKVQQILDLHEQVLALQETLEFFEATDNVVTEVVTENALSLDDKNIVPSNQQLLAIRDLIRFLFTNKKPEGFSSVAYLKGYAGTGKTNIVLKWFTKLSGLKTNEIFATGHNQHSSKAINDSIGTNQAKSIQDLKDALKSNNLQATKLIVIDEINGLDIKEITEIVDLLNKYNVANKTQIKLVGLGDPNQVTTSQNDLFSPLDTINKTKHTLTLITPLTIRYRSNVSAVVEAQDLFMGQTKDVAKDKVYLSTNANKTLGADGSLSSNGIEESLKQRDLKDGKTRAIIVHPNDVQKWKEKIAKDPSLKDIEVVSYVDVQGRTLDEVFLDIPQSYFSDVFMYNKAMYTAASRATNFIYFQGLNTETIIDDTVNKNTEKSTNEIKEARKAFQQNRQDEITQLDADVKLATKATEVKPAKTKPTEPETAKPQTQPEPSEPSESEDFEEYFPDDEKDELEQEEEIVELPESEVEEEGIDLKYPTKKSFVDLVIESLGISVPAVKDGEEIIYVPVVNRQGFKSIGIYVNRDGKYLEVGMLSQEELNNPPQSKIKQYNEFKKALEGKQVTTFENDGQGYLQVNANLSKLHVLAKGKIKNVSPLKFIYGQVNKAFKLDQVINLFKEGFFKNNKEGAASRISESKVRIFTRSEIEALKPENPNIPLKPGIPYVMIVSPAQDGSKRNKNMFIKLNRRMLNRNDHAFLLNPIYEFIDNYNKFRASLPNLTVSQIAEILDSSDDYLETILKDLNVTLTNEQKDLRKAIDVALHEPLSEQDLVIKKGSKVKNTKDPFLNEAGKEIKGTVKSIENNEATVTVNGKDEKIPLSELRVAMNRRPGKAQHAFNLIARGNRTSNAHVIRLTKSDSKGKKITSGKSLLPRFEDSNFDAFVDKFNNYSQSKQLKALQKFEKVYGRPLNQEAIKSTDRAIRQTESLMLMRAIDSAMTPETLNDIFKQNEDGTVSDLRVPVSREASFEDLGEAIRVDYTDNYQPSNNDALFFETNFEGVNPTSASVTLDSKIEEVKPDTTDVTNKARPRNNRRLLAKDRDSKLGEKMTLKSIVAYLKSIDKTLSEEEIKFVTEAELLELTEGKEAWGMYKNGLLYLSQDNFDMAYKNVARHELFHRIFEMMLTDSQRELVYKKAIEEFGLDENISLDDLEEVLAGKYQEFRNNKPISTFFKTLFNRIKRFLGMSTNLIPSIDEFFANIDSGLFDQIVSIDNSTKNYGDIKKDFETAYNFRKAQLYIVNELETLQSQTDNIDFVEEGFLPQSIGEMINDIYLNILNDYNELSKEKDLTEKDAELLKIVSIIKDKRIFKELVEDMFEGLKVNNLKVVESDESLISQTETTVDNFDILGSDWTDDIKDAEETNHETKLSTKVKQFLSTIIYQDPVTKEYKQVNPRYAFLLVLENLSNMAGTNATEIKKAIEERFRIFKLADNTGSEAVKRKLLSLVDFAYTDTIKDVEFPEGFRFTKESTFIQDFIEDGKIVPKALNKLENETLGDFITRIAAKTGLPVKTVSALYINYNAQNTFLELYSQVSSLYRQEVYQGTYTGGKENTKQTFKPLTQEAEISKNNNNLSTAFLINISSKVKDVVMATWASSELTKASKLKSSEEKEKIKIVKDVFFKLFGYNLLDTEDIGSVIESVQDLISGYNNVKTAEELEAYKSNFTKNNNGRLSSLSLRIVKGEEELRPANFRRGDGKTAYLFTLASQAINTIQYFANPNIFPRPEFLDSPYMQKNIFVNGISKIYDYVNFDSIKSEYNDKNTRYKNETEQDWLARNFKYFFLAGLEKGTYVQQFLTISNKPNIIGAKVKFLNWSQAESAIVGILDQQSTRNFPGKVKNDLNVFEKLVARKPNITNAQYAKDIVKAMKGKTEELKSLLNVETYTDANNLETAAKEYTNGSIDDLLALYYANFYINSNQLNQLVAGDEAFYKNSFDVIKRMSIAFATGYRGLVSKFALPKYYKTLIVKDIKGILGEDFKEFQRIIGKDFDLTDAQGYMTPKRAEQLRKSFGSAFKLGSIVKPVHFEIDKNGVPRAVKYSCIELTDGLCEMFPRLKQVREMLEANDIDEMVFESAVKVGKPSSIIEANEDGTLPAIDPNSIITLQNENYRIQSNPEHNVENDDVAFPTQLGYFFNFSGQNPELASELFNAMESLMNIGLTRTLSKLKMSKRIEDDNKEGSQNDQRNAIRQEAADKQMNSRNQRELQFLQNPKLGINTPFLINKVITDLASLFTSSTVGIRIPGGGLVLQSAYGTAEFTDKDGNLVKRDLKWRDKDGFAEVVLPDFWKGKFKEGDQIMFDTMIGFRIPSTELHSAIPLKVVGFYPGNKNAIIAPKEIVYFHGSDYDVDKLYVMRRDTFNNRNDVKTLDGKVLYKAGTTTPTTKEFRSELREEKIKAKELFVEAKTANDKPRMAALNKHIKTLRLLEESYYKNVIVDSFVKVTTAKVNENLMMSPISMERFKGAGIEDETAFDLVARLKGFKTPKPTLEKATSLKAYNEAIDEWLEERNKVIFKERNLYDVKDQLAMHQDNFSGTKLTGIFANLAKSVAYFFQSTTDGKYPQLKESVHISLNGKKYEGLNYFENSNEVIVNYNEKGEPIKSKPLITETIDSLVNAAIDNVKEQILPIIGFTNALGNTAVALVSMGIPLKQVILSTTQPIAELISQSGSFNRGYINARITLLKALENKYTSAGKIITETDIERFTKKADELNITEKELEGTFGKNIDEMSEKELLLQFAVLKQVLSKGNTIGECLSTASTAYGVLKKLPIEFAGMQNNLEAFDSLWNEETGTPGKDMVFTNVNPIKLPHINKAFTVLKTLKSKVELLFFAHNKVLQAFSESLGERIVEVETEDGVSESKILDFNTGLDQNSYLSQLRTHVVHYLMTGLTYTTPEGYTITNSTLNEPAYEVGKGKQKVGLDAFNYRFKDEVTRMRRENPKNSFLKAFYINPKGKLIFNGGKNLDQADMLEFQKDFEALKENGQYTKFQYEFVKFAVINQGLAFGSNNYSLILPSELYEPMMEQFNNYFNELTGNPEKFKEVLDKIKLNFKLQYALNTGGSTVPYVSKEQYVQGKDFYGIQLISTAEKPIKIPKLFVKVYNNLYVLADANTFKYAYVGAINDNNVTSYQYDESILKGDYSFKEAFKLNYPVVKVENTDNVGKTISNKYKYEIGSKVRLVNYSDVTRLKMKEAEILDSKYDNGIYIYTISEPVLVNTIVSDVELSQTREYLDLINSGFTAEAALHKLKNNC